MCVSNCVSRVRVRHQPFFLGSSTSTAGLLELCELDMVSGVALLVIVGSWVVNSLYCGRCGARNARWCGLRWVFGTCSGKDPSIYINIWGKIQAEAFKEECGGRLSFLWVE